MGHAAPRWRRQQLLGFGSCPSFGHSANSPGAATVCLSCLRPTVPALLPEHSSRVPDVRPAARLGSRLWRAGRPQGCWQAAQRGAALPPPLPPPPPLPLAAAGCGHPPLWPHCLTTSAAAPAASLHCCPAPASLAQTHTRVGHTPGGGVFSVSTSTSTGGGGPQRHEAAELHRVTGGLPCIPEQSS